MARTTLLLLQACAVCASAGIARQDKAACADGTEGACLAGDELSVEESSFIQERSSRAELRVATGGARDLLDGLPGGFPTDDYLTSMGGVNDTINEVHKAVELVNSTVVKMLGEIQSSSGALTSALDLAKSGAEHTKFIIGDKAVKTVEQLVDKLGSLSKSFIVVANETAGEAQHEVQKLWLELETKKDEIIERVTSAEKAILSMKGGGNASLLQAGSEVESRGPFGWLWRILGFGRRKAQSPCEKAQESLTAANSSLLDFESLIDRFNSTVSGEFLDDFIGRVRDGLHQFESSVQDVISGVSDSIPSAVKSALSEAVKTFGTAAEKLKQQLEPVEKSVAKFLEDAKAPLATVRTSLGKSETSLTAKCS